MGQLTPSFLFDVEKRMRIIASQDYDRLNNNLIWTRVAKELTSTGKSERLIWLLDTMKIQYQDRLGGSIEFEDLLSNTVEFTNKSATAGLKLNKYQLDDHDGGGLQLATAWARGAGAYAAYWPQKQIMAAIRAGGTAGNTTYDGLTFFNASHPVNPFDSTAGVFSNDLTGAASGVFPGACPIDESVALDVAVANVQKVIAYIRSLIQPNGEDPRMLRASAILAPPALTARVAAITGAKFISGASGGQNGGTGSTETEALIRSFGMQEPLIADELGLGISGGSNTTWYMLVENTMSDQLGALVYVNREPFEIVYNTGMTDAELQKANDLQWTTRGRNVVGYGHPYLLFKVRAT